MFSIIKKERLNSNTLFNIGTMPHLRRMNWDYADQLQYADLSGGGEVWYVYDASGERVRKVIENRDITEERLYLGGYEIWTKTINGQTDKTRETLHVVRLPRSFGDGTKRIAILDTEKATSSGTGGTTSGTTTTLPGSDPGADLGKTTIRYQYDNHLGSASLRTALQVSKHKRTQKTGLKKLKNAIEKHHLLQ